MQDLKRIEASLAFPEAKLKAKIKEKERKARDLENCYKFS